MPYLTSLPTGFTDADEVKAPGGPRSPGRRPTCKHFRKGGDGAANFHIGRIHYFDQFNLDGSGSRYRECDTTLVDRAGSFTFGGAYADYLPSIGGYSDEWTKFKNLHPRGRGPDPSAYDEVGFRIPNRVRGTIETSHDGWIRQSVVYPDALGAGVHLRAVCGNGQLGHIAQIDAAPSGLGRYLSLDYEIGVGSLNVKILGRAWYGERPRKTTGSVAIGKPGEEIVLRDFMAWDSAGATVNVEVEFSLEGGVLHMTKHIPTTWLHDPARAYPVFTDATISPFAEVGDGNVKREDADTVWSDCHDNTDGTVANYTANSVAESNLITTLYAIYRSFVAFDTSSLPASPTFNSAALNLYGYNKVDNGGDVGVQEGTQASTSQLTTADFDAFTGSELASRITLTSWDTAGYNVFTLSDTTTIDDAGFSKFCLREGSQDIDDSAPTTRNTAFFRGQETAGTSQDPFFAIDYTGLAQGSVTLSGTGSIGATARKTGRGSAALSGVGSLAPTAHKTGRGAAGLDGSGELVPTAHKTGSGAAGMAGSGTLAISARKTGRGSVDLDGTGTLSASGSGGSSAGEESGKGSMRFTGAL